MQPHRLNIYALRSCTKMSVSAADGVASALFGGVCGSASLWIRTTEVSSPNLPEYMAGAAESLGPVRGKPLGVLRMESMAERVADHLIGHHPAVPGLGQAEQARTAARGLIHALHASRMPGHARPYLRPGQSDLPQSDAPAPQGRGIWHTVTTAPDIFTRREPRGSAVPRLSREPRAPALLSSPASGLINSGMRRPAPNGMCAR